jgi:hypothetical protein
LESSGGSPARIRWRCAGRQALAGCRTRTAIAIDSITRACIEDVMSKGRVLSEFWMFLRQEKKYWLVPIVVVFVLFGLLIVFSQSSAVAPFIYTLF